MTKYLMWHDWEKTPYAKSKAKYSDAALLALLTKYRIKTHQTTYHLGPQGRSAITLRFIFRDKPYRICGETMWVENRVDPDQLMLQCKRWIYWYLKGLLELVDYFGPAEQLMLGFLESGDGGTVYQAIKPRLEQMPSAPQLLELMKQTLPALPAPNETIDGEEV